MLSFERAAILGATGPTGRFLSRALDGRVPEIRVCSRSEEHLKEVFPSQTFERVPSDALDEGQTLRAVEGCDVVFDCIGLPGELMHKHPLTAENIARAVEKTGARSVQVSSYWAYLPFVALPLTEQHPRTGSPPWVRHRREAEDVLQKAGAAILHLPDFFGPHVHTSPLQNALTDAMHGRPMNWIGRADVEHEFIYVPDAMATAADVAHHENAYGERWVLPGGGPLTGAELTEIVAEHLGRDVKLRTAGPMMLRLVSWFDEDLRGFMQMVPHYVGASAYDGSKLANLIGEPRRTPYGRAIAETLEWLRTRA